ncbi:MAG: DMT family transporter [Chloroflexota bacterium]
MGAANGWKTGGGWLSALLAALLFGASAPLAKRLVGEIDPLVLAALLYLGAGLGVLLARLAGAAAAGRSGGSGAAAPAEAPLQRSDYRWLAGAVLAGGVAAPVLLMYSLRSTPGATASLLLNFEAAATTLLAWLFFRESLGRAVLLPLGLITLASALLSLDPAGGWGVSAGALGVLGACVLWGLDNNFTGQISAKDPQVIVTVKGLAAGGFSCLLALLLGRPLPGLAQAGAAMLLGALSYGASILLFIDALRALGTARTSALFGAAPLMGAAIAVLVFGEALPPLTGAAMMLTGAGVWLLSRERHAHLHMHAVLAHDHRHAHDAHHLHHPGSEAQAVQPGGDTGGVQPGGAHAHPHEHPQQEHAHDHRPDLHHRHE